ncbi:hypothetical protein J6590_053928 [Homalodisca vitripennis]|nr:hypothetical protein J6590_053928 [Homalodisca vitripennis]
MYYSLSIEYTEEEGKYSPTYVSCTKALVCAPSRELVILWSSAVSLPAVPHRGYDAPHRFNTSASLSESFVVQLTTI